jgi:nucleoside-diphosphate-sugar epimerase
MWVLLTGGSGDLGQVVSVELAERGDVPLCLDVRKPDFAGCIYLPGSILDRDALRKAMVKVDAVVHIAAWHGIHAFRKEKDVYDFWDLNVTGTFNVFEAAQAASIRRVIYISSTDAEEPYTVYGHTKVMGETIAQTYAARHGMQVLILRPRAFIPYWNRMVYSSFIEWARWFWGGAVHIDDVAQAVLKSLDVLAGKPLENTPILNVDGAYEYTADDLAQWDADGAGSTFRGYYAAFYDLAVECGLDPTQAPTQKDMQATRDVLGYAPGYSLRNLLEELATFGADGPPAPAWKKG